MFAGTGIISCGATLLDAVLRTTRPLTCTSYTCSITGTPVSATRARAFSPRPQKPIRKPYPAAITPPAALCTES